MILLLLEATLVAQTAISGWLTSASYLCQPCRQRWLNRPRFDALNGLVSAWNELHVCLPAGKTLTWLTEQITLWQAKTRSELVVSAEQSAKSKNAGTLVLVSCAVLK